jgi:exopolyphosphatase/guanosine-5'-triphosphate,3'-diphosphate pyrophosphatase
LDVFAPGSSTSKFGAIDIGSHTIRLLIAELDEDRTIRPLCIERRITRLARNFQDGETLKRPAIERSIEALRQYAALLKRFDVRSVACGATGVIRRARNSSDFLHIVEKSTGICPSILSEESEAYLSAKGSLSVLPTRQKRILAFDLGGSSTEFLLADSSQTGPLWSTSVFIGAATLTERFLTQDPPAKERIAQASNSARTALGSTLSHAKNLLNTSSGSSLQLVGTAGTVTTLAAMHLKMDVYEPYRVNGHVLTLEWLTETIDLLAGLDLASRRSLPGLEEGREDIILGGALIVREILHGMEQSQLTVTDGGLLEGLLLDHMEQKSGCPPSLIDPLTWRLQEG